MAKINWEEFLNVPPPKYGLQSAQEPPDVWEEEKPLPEVWDQATIPGCQCPICQHSMKLSAQYQAGPMQTPEPKFPGGETNMPKEGYNLARISRGEEGKTAYFYFEDMKKAPKTIVWLWSDGFVSVHEKKSGQPKVLETTKEWWDGHVLNAAWPSKELIEDLYKDVFVPRNTKTYRYQIIENEKKYHKVTAGKLLSDPVFLKGMVSRMHDAAELTGYIDEVTNKPTPKKAPKKTGNPVKKTPEGKILIEFDDLDEEEDDNPFKDVPPATSLSGTVQSSKITVSEVDATGKPVGKPVNVNGVTIGTVYEDEIHNTPVWAQGGNVQINWTGNNAWDVIDQDAWKLKQQMLYGQVINPNIYPPKGF